MDSKIKKAQLLKVELETQPGELSKIFSAFHESNLNVIASWAWEMGPAQAEAVFYPADFEKTKTVLSTLGYEPTVTWACHAEGTDKVGVYAEVLGKISKADINLSATDAFSSNGNNSTMLFVEEEDFSALCKTLGC